MPLPPFTPANVAATLTALYAKTDPEVIVQADLIEADLNAWLRANFAFTTPQSTYMDGIKDEAMKYFGQQCAICFRYRLNIDVVYPAPPGPGYGKYVEQTSTVKLTVDGSGDVEATGELTFTMIYRL